MVGPENGEALSADDLAAALDYIRATPAIWEVILTGGDPFVLSPRRIREVTEALSAIPHVKVLRWHTRVPVVDPERVTEALIAALRATTKTVFVGLHTNHPRELTGEARAAIARIVDAGIPIVSQTVLLRGVNDDADTLEALMRALVEVRVKPYYLHHGDLAPGTAHFRTTIAEGRALMAELRRRLSGLALPTYVLDLPGAHGKVPLESRALRSAQAHTAFGTRANTNTSTKTAARPRTHRERALHSGKSRISAKADKSNNNQFEKRRMRIFLHCEIMNAFQLDASGERCESARKCINNERPTGRQS